MSLNISRGAYQNLYSSDRISSLLGNGLLVFTNNKTKMNKFLNKNEIIILLKEKFKTERGRINCSLREKGGKWRWLGIQYVIAEY